MQNALKHVNNVFKGPEGVKSALSMFMKSIEEENEFLSAWNAILEECNVRDNNWLEIIFELTEKWAYAYNKKAWISSRASESEKTYKLANEHAIKLAKLIEDLLNLKMDGNKIKKIQNSPPIKHSSSTKMDVQQNATIAEGKGLEEKESSRGRCTFKSGLEIVLAKKKKLYNCQLHSQMSQAPIQSVPAVNSTLRSSMVLHSYLNDKHGMYITSLAKAKNQQRLRIHQQYLTDMPHLLFGFTISENTSVVFEWGKEAAFTQCYLRKETPPHALWGFELLLSNSSHHSAKGRVAEFN
ncbi:hypothetical protein WN944_023937 [Citrus x changshan-huyou]|uniref:Protein FAR1-RELATED SEQUENCE n=1 Tax=Citrus x changshan-huyou TaxID=2935761 RepID=A0AAP0QF89_9ROSI